MRLELQKMNYKIYLVPEIIYDPMPPWSVSCVHFCRNWTCRMAMIGFKGKNASFSPDPGGLRGPGLPVAPWDRSRACPLCSGNR